MLFDRSCLIFLGGFAVGVVLQVFYQGASGFDFDAAVEASGVGGVGTLGNGLESRAALHADGLAIDAFADQVIGSNLGAAEGEVHLQSFVGAVGVVVGGGVAFDHEDVAVAFDEQRDLIERAHRL